MNPETKLLVLLILIGIFAGLSPWLAWRKIQALEKKHGSKLLVRGITGEQAAKIILLRGGISQVNVDETSVIFSNQYSAHEPAIKLSSEVYYGKRLFDVARAARLAGQALQHRDRQYGKLGVWESLIVFWGNTWPLFILLSLLGKSRFLSAVVVFAVITTFLTVVHFLKYAQVRDAAARGEIVLTEAKLLEGHPTEEIDSAFKVACLDYLALPYTRTWWRWMFLK
ncbi:MAG: zinc metallopeptidase [Opitutales bacterium]|nr:zinc metallopeptidase [Opitutales bacterium]